MTPYWTPAKIQAHAEAMAVKAARAAEMAKAILLAKGRC